MAPHREPEAEEIGSAVLGMFPAVDRIVGGALGFSIGAAIGCIARLVPGVTLLDPVSSTLLGGVIGSLVGVALPPTIKRPELPVLTTAMPGTPVPVIALGREGGRALDRPTANAFVLGVAIGIGALPVGVVVHLLLGIRPSIAVFGIIAIAGFGAAIACVSFLPPLLLPKPTRSALAASLWLGGREFERSFGSRLAVAGFPVRPEEVAPWVSRHPETEESRQGHAELHLIAGDWEAARSTLERMPERTPRERFDRRILESILRYQLTGEADETAAREAMAAIPPGTDRIEAEVGLAIFAARRRLPDGDWRQPLVDVRHLIPGSDAALLLRDPGWVLFMLIARQTWPIFVLLVAITIGGVVLSMLLGGGG